MSSSFSGAFSPQGIVVSTSGHQQGNVTMATVNPSQGMTGILHFKTFFFNHLTGLTTVILLISSLYAGNTVYQPVTVVTPQGQVVTQAISPGTIHIQNSQVCIIVHPTQNLFKHRSHSLLLCFSMAASTSAQSGLEFLRC